MSSDYSDFHHEMTIHESNGSPQFSRMGAKSILIHGLNKSGYIYSSKVEFVMNNSGGL